MSAETCPSCGKRKGRRACPALAHTICAVCCGTKRLVEIRCPSDCAYLASAEQHPPAVVQRRREVQGRVLASVVDGLAQAQYQLFLLVQLTIARYLPRVTDQLLDRDVADAAAALAATFETATKGIIYDHLAVSLPAQRLSAEVRTAIDALGREGHPPRDGDVAVALRRTEKAVEEAGRAIGGERAYLELVADVFARASEQPRRAGPAERAPGASRLIIP
jgi:hypothetical protein